jgi:serine/threonine-protein kinase
VPDSHATAPLGSSAFLAGQHLGGRYRLEHRIASGGMAEVWQAEDEVLGRHVAVKILHPHLAADATFVARFRSEAIAAARLHHPSIVSIYDTTHDDGFEAIVMELVRGTTLRDQLDGRMVLTPREVVHIGAEVSDALAAAHRAGLVHRDIKPANILLCADDRILVTDFGIAKIRDDTDHTQAGTMLGTVKYLAPEQVRGEPVDGRADVYALGVVLFECLCARTPFSGDNPAATALARLHQPVPRPSHLRPTIPRGLDQVVLKCLQIDPAARYQSAAELRAALLEPSTLFVEDDFTERDLADDLTLAAAPTANGPASAWAAGAGVAAGGDLRSTGYEPPPRHGAWIRPVLAVGLVVTAVVVALLLVGQTDLGRRLLGQDTTNHHATTTTSLPPAPAVRSVASFDPFGQGTPGEDDVNLPKLIDGNPATGWTTEWYSDRHFGNLKPGVGVIVHLDQKSTVGSIVLSSPTQDWAAQIYTTDATSDPTSLAGWGTPVATRTAIAGTATIQLGHRSATSVLVWITDLGNGPAPVRAEIDEIALKA